MTSPDAPLIVENRGATQWLTLNRPGSLNALNIELAEALAERFHALRSDELTRVVVLRGAGRGFCSGLDVKEQIADPRSAKVAQDLREVVLGIDRCPQPVVALVHGPVCGGGLAFALAADIRVAGESALFKDAFISLGVSGCELGLSYFLPRQVGQTLAAEIIYTGRELSAARAFQAGLVSQVVPDATLEAVGASLAADMLRAAPLALRKTKEVFRHAATMADLEAVMDLEFDAQAECVRGPHYEEGLRALVERRAPRFKSC